MTLAYSIFQDVLFPPEGAETIDQGAAVLQLRRLHRFMPANDSLLRDVPIIVFDFETTGLDTALDEIIEVGAIKWLNGKVVDKFESFVSTNITLSEDIVRLTGIQQSMLEGQPTFAELSSKFLKFIDQSILVAHNAEFDYAMLRAALSRLSVDLDWACFCTLKMARAVLPDLDNRKLDTLAEHYGLTFAARHRSIGDAEVTLGVLQSLIAEAGVAKWGDLQSYIVNAATQ